MRVALLLIFASLSLRAATLAQVRTRVDDWLAARWSAVVNKQDNYFAAHGVYWQGLITHSGFPNHTSDAYADAVADLLGSKPTDGRETWAQAFPTLDGIAFPAALRVDVYGGPQGQGWVATIYVRYNGTIYTRARNVGPETWRTYGWRVYEEPEL